MRKFSKKQYLVAGAAAVIVAAGTGAAYAYWTTSGTGTGSAATASDAAGITVNQTSTVSNLAPGADAQALSGNFDNSNASPVKITQVNVDFDPAMTWQLGCSSADYTLTQPDPQSGLVPTGTGVGSWAGGSIKMNDLAANQDGCKGQVVALVYSTTTAPGA